MYLILGIIQGVTEWLPMSSSAMITLVLTNFFNITNVDIILRSALFLHLGTFFAALIYFKKEVSRIFFTITNYKNSPPEYQNLLKFLIIATIASSIIGIIIIKFLPIIFSTLFSFKSHLALTGKTITLLVGILLLFTGTLQIKIRRRGGLRNERQIKNSDGILLGLVQGLAALPGISRSGITISTLLLRKFNDTTALQLSFLMSLPIILLGNIFLNITHFTFSLNALYGVLTAFIVGLATIHGLMKLSKKVNFGWFVLGFGLLMIVSVIVF